MTIGFDFRQFYTVGTGVPPSGGLCRKKNLTVRLFMIVYIYIYLQMVLAIEKDTDVLLFYCIRSAVGTWCYNALPKEEIIRYVIP